MVQHTRKNQYSNSNNSNNPPVEAIAGIATQQPPQAATMLKSVSTNTLIFDDKNEKFDFFEDLIHSMLRIQPKMTKATKNNHFHAQLRKEALQLFGNISASYRKNFDDVLIVFRRKFVKPESQSTAKHEWHKLTFDSSARSLFDFLEELNECSEKLFDDNDQQMIDSLIYAKLPSLSKR